MSEYSKLVEEFQERYEEPVVDEYIQGFSGIDPPLRHTSGQTNHELLNGLLGGNEEGHYHLTKEQLDGLISLLDEKYPPSIRSGQVVRVTAGEAMSAYEVQGENVR